VSNPYGPGRPPGDGWYNPDPQPWDPAYPHPVGATPHYGYGPYQPAPPPPAPVRPRHARGLISAVVVLSLALVTSLVLLVTGVTRTTDGTALSANGGGTGTLPGSSSGGSSGGGSGNSGGGSSGGGGTAPTPGNGNFPFPSNNGSSGSTGKATSAQQVGVVDIYTVQKYNQAEAAGTGMVLTSTGDILTNNHVVEGATSIKVRIVSTGKVYAAKVVGTAPTKDIAVVRLVNASGLQTAGFGDSGTVSVGDAVVGVGNAGGTGGTPSAASGKVTALHRTITASDESGSNSEKLHDVIVTDAPIQSGDSGGPLYNSDGKVVGIDTAASTSGQRIGFAIPINDALSISQQIEKGIATSSIHIGYPGFLGVSVLPSSSGALVQGALQGGPAARAGIGAGDKITRVNDTTITNSTQLRKTVSAYQPGSRVSVTYTDPNTGRHTVSVTLATGPAD
jgi:S1-C subfamily serine protease